MAKTTKRAQRTDARPNESSSRPRGRRSRSSTKADPPSLPAESIAAPAPPAPKLAHPPEPPIRIPRTEHALDLSDFSAGILDPEDGFMTAGEPVDRIEPGRGFPEVILEDRAVDHDLADNVEQIGAPVDSDDPRRGVFDEPDESFHQTHHLGAERSAGGNNDRPARAVDGSDHARGADGEERRRGRRRGRRGRGRRGKGEAAGGATTESVNEAPRGLPAEPSRSTPDERWAALDLDDEQPDVAVADEGAIEEVDQTEDVASAVEAPPDRAPARPRGRSGVDSRRGPVRARDDADDRDLPFEEDEEDAEDADDTAAQSSDNRVMLINVADPDECRIALLRNGRLDELYMERAASTSHVGNIYKGRVTNVEGSIQAAFVDFGLPSHGFLHISDLHPQYFPDGKRNDTELVGRKTPRRQRPPIQACLRRGQEVIVQIIKEGIGTKGPTLTSYISLPGRFLVMMPGMDQLGVSRKIEDEDQRRELRQLLSELTLPPEMGFIVRTAGIGRTKRELQRDLHYLARLWKRVKARMQSEPAPAELYQESNLVIRTIRDVYDSSISKILVDSGEVADSVREFLTIASPRMPDIVEHYQGSEPMFHRHGIEAEIDKLHSRHVPLACGGSLVIEQTEALVAIDVNSGRFRVPDNAEETAYRVNVEAVEEIARQLRLRDLGGLIICDFIDMIQERHRRDIEQRLRDALKKHKERAKILRMSKFGIIEMTRQRQRPSFAKSMFRDCPVCAGAGRVKATESVALDVMRQIRLASHREGVASVDVRVSTTVANDLLNRKRQQLTDLERATNQSIRIHGEPAFLIDQVEVSCTDRRGRELNLLTNSGDGRGHPAHQGGHGPPPGGRPPHPDDRGRRHDRRGGQRQQGRRRESRGGGNRPR